MQLTAEPPVAVERPLLRGALHGVAFAASLGVGALLVVFSRESRVLPATVFACSAALMLGTSSLYHRVTWLRARDCGCGVPTTPGSSC